MAERRRARVERRRYTALAQAQAVQTFDYYGPMLRTSRLASPLLLVAAAALAMFTAPAWATVPADAGPGASKTLQAAEKAEAVSAAATAELFYEVLVGELAVGGGDPGQGYALMLDAARRSHSSELYRRATEIALQSRSAQSALTAAQAWHQADPESRDANRFVLRILVALNRIQDSSEPLARELANAPEGSKIAVINAIPLLYAHASDKELAARVVEAALTELQDQPATSANAWTTTGRMRLAAGDKPGALVAARLAHKMDPANDAMAAFVLQLLDEKVTEAEPLLKPYLDEHPLAEVRLGYARYLSETSQYDKALVQMRTVTSEQPDNAQAWLLQSTLELQAGKVDAAETTLNHFAELYQQLPASEQVQAQTRQMYLLRSEIAQSRGDLIQRRAPRDRLEAPLALGAHAAQRRQDALGVVRALGVARHFGTQHAVGRRVRRVAAHAHRAAVVHRGDQAAGVGAVVRAGADDLAHRRRGAFGHGHPQRRDITRGAPQKRG